MSSAVKLCISILPVNEEELKILLPECHEGDLIEIRFDRLHWVNPQLISRHDSTPIIMSVRTKEEGGFFDGSAARLTPIYQQAIDAGVSYIDVSSNRADEILPRLEFGGKTKLISSHHSKESNLTSLKRKLDEMTAVKADVYKLVFQAESLNDNITAMRLIDYAKRLNVSFVIHAIGEGGRLSRIMGSFKGNAWTYVSLTDHEQTAPGQLNIVEAKYQYYLQEKNAYTRIIGLVGYPIAQSRGWRLYNRVFHLLNQSGDSPQLNIIYLNFPVLNLNEFWEQWQNQIEGMSVTIPHKEGILRFANRKSREVERSGVCNTLLKRDGEWEAHNVDLLAIIELLQPHKKQLSEGEVLVYGTGATTRSAIAALQNLGIERIYLMGRNKERGCLLADLFSVTFLEDDADPPDLSAIIQTTPVGMHPNVDEMPPCAKYLRKGMIAVDVVPNPPITRFLRTAKEKSCITISGEEMYLHQAARQFKLFTGVSASSGYLKKIWNELFG